MEKETLDRVLFEKAKHLRAKDASQLYTLAQNCNEYQIMRLSSVSTVNPLTISLLFWLLPPFFVIHKFFIREYIGGIIQVVMTILAPFVFYATRTKYSFIQNGDQVTQVVNDSQSAKIIGTGWIIFLCLWFFVDGLTVYSRTKISNFKKLKNQLK